MQLIELTRTDQENHGASEGGAADDIDIAGLALDSRDVEPGYLFAALPGSQHDGRDFIADAIERGATAVLAPPGTAIKQHSVRLVTDPDTRVRLSHMAARFYGPQPKWVTAVTGTNGKSSVADMARQIWQLMGHAPASIGTLGIHTRKGAIAAPGLTTLDPISLHKTLAELARVGTTHVALEASSHGLDQARVDAVEIAAAAFTTFGRDHLDYHHNQADYFSAKARLFDRILPAGGTAVLNADIPEFGPLKKICAARRHDISSYGVAGEIKLIKVAPRADGQEIEFELAGQSHKVALPLFGAFQAHNMLASLGLVLATETDHQAVLAALPGLRGVPGRMEHVASHPNGAGIFVDYAHTHDALTTALTSIRPHCAGRLIVVFGAGGDRDTGKRPLMGTAAAALADAIFVTDDNPRSENPADIRAQILATCPGATEIGDRQAAIGTAIASLSAKDILIIAGKGHETGQITADGLIEFNDAEIATRFAAEMSAS